MSCLGPPATPPHQLLEKHTTTNESGQKFTQHIFRHFQRFCINLNFECKWANFPECATILRREVKAAPATLQISQSPKPSPETANCQLDKLHKSLQGYSPVSFSLLLFFFSLHPLTPAGVNCDAVATKWFSFGPAIVNASLNLIACTCLRQVHKI